MNENQTQAPAAPQYPYQPPAPQPRGNSATRWMGRHKVLTCVAAFLLFGIFANATDDPAPEASAKEETVKTTRAERQAAVDAGNWEPEEKAEPAPKPSMAEVREAVFFDNVREQLPMYEYVPDANLRKLGRMACDGAGELDSVVALEYFIGEAARASDGAVTDTEMATFMGMSFATYCPQSPAARLLERL